MVDTRQSAGDSAVLLAALNGLAGPHPEPAATALRALLEAQHRLDLAAVLAC